MDFTDLNDYMNNALIDNYYRHLNEQEKKQEFIGLLEKYITEKLSNVGCAIDAYYKNLNIKTKFTILDKFIKDEDKKTSFQNFVNLFESHMSKFQNYMICITELDKEETTYIVTKDEEFIYNINYSKIYPLDLVLNLLEEYINLPEKKKTTGLRKVYDIYEIHNGTI